ncbi:unnamed protein product [Brugia timori]|uniref:peptide deformylase n=1 Tax=Brugia timori TaxID=42155 RepID=A0A0R3QCM6_9BILA|nr:unnamed protein product [Brugia timori]
MMSTTSDLVHSPPISAIAVPSSFSSSLRQAKPAEHAEAMQLAMLILLLLLELPLILTIRQIIFVVPLSKTAKTFLLEGFGLAAVQIGVLERIFVMDIQLEDIKGEPVGYECTEQNHEIRLPKYLNVKYKDLNNKEQTLKASGCLQAVSSMSRSPITVYYILDIYLN